MRRQAAGDKEMTVAEKHLTRGPTYGKGGGKNSGEGGNFVHGAEKGWTEGEMWVVGWRRVGSCTTFNNAARRRIDTWFNSIIS